MKLWPFHTRAPSIEDCARRMSEFRVLSERERSKARARMMRAEMGLSPDPRLEPRT